MEITPNNRILECERQNEKILQEKDIELSKINQDMKELKEEIFNLKQLYDN